MGVLPSRDDVLEVLTEPEEVMRWGVAVASVVIVLVAFGLERVFS